MDDLKIDFLTADLHLGHKRIIRNHANDTCRRNHDTVEEHDAFLEDNWNKTVSPHHTVAVLGDVLFDEKAFEILKRLNGNKILIMGNHDDFPSRRYHESFSQIFGALKYQRKFILTHIPVHPGQFSRYKYNIHGHLHSESIDDPRYICVSVDQYEFKPVAFETIHDLLQFNCRDLK